MAFRILRMLLNGRGQNFISRPAPIGIAFTPCAITSSRSSSVESMSFSSAESSLSSTVSTVVDDSDDTDVVDLILEVDLIFSGMTAIIGSSPNRVTWLILDLCFRLEYCLTFFLDLKVDAKRDAPHNDKVFEDEVGKTVGNTAVLGPGASAVSDFSMRP
jgi:hypothetical protein